MVQRAPGQFLHVRNRDDGPDPDLEYRGLCNRHRLVVANHRVSTALVVNVGYFADFIPPLPESEDVSGFPLPQPSAGQGAGRCPR